MKTINNNLKSGLGCILAAALLTLGSTAYALPALQLGPDPSDLASWNYDTISETWITSATGSFNVSAYANCDSATSGCNSANGNYAWDSVEDPRVAYLSIAAAPDLGNTGLDAFDVSVLGASFVTSGYGTPPLEDSNSIAGHGIYDTYFEIYEFIFDGAIQTIYDVQPGQTGSGDGYMESIGVTINSLLDGVSGLHFDLYTVDVENQVMSFAPFSHDAEWTTSIPEPGTFALLGLALVAVGISRRKA